MAMAMAMAGKDMGMGGTVIQQDRADRQEEGS